MVNISTPVRQSEFPPIERVTGVVLSTLTSFSNIDIVAYLLHRVSQFLPIN